VSSFLFVVVLVASTSRQRNSLFVLVPLIVVAFGASLLLAEERAFHRLATIWRILEIETAAEIGGLRAVVWKDTLSIARHFPVLGSGMGTFFFVFAIYRSFYTPAFCLHAHGDWFEHLGETGLVGMVLALALGTALVVYVVRGIRACRDPLAWGLMAGGLAALIAIFLHSFVDFNLHVPSNALYLSVITALTIATSRRQQSHEQHEEESVSRERAYTVFAKRVLWVVVVLSGAGLWSWQLMRGYRAERNLEAFRAAVSSLEDGRAPPSGEQPKLLEEVLELADSVKKCAGKDAEYHFQVGQDLLFLAAGRETLPVTLSPLERLQLLDAAHEALERACKLNPIFGEYHYWLGESYVAAGVDWEAEKEFEKAAVLYPSDLRMRKDIARFYQRIGNSERARHHLQAAERYRG